MHSSAIRAFEAFHIMNISDAAFELPTALTLPDGEVHIWHVDVEALAVREAQWQQLLSPDEQLRAKHYLSVLARQTFVVTRGLLRGLLSAYLQTDQERISFQYAAMGKPALNPQHLDSNIRFNVSHADGIALLAFSRGRALGVDVEQVHRVLDIDAIATRFFSAEEQKQLAIVSEDRYAAFFRCWTRKEAYIKAIGEGLSLPLSQFDVSLASGDTNALLSTRPDGSEAARWSLREISVGSGYMAALCVEGHGWHLRSWPGQAASLGSSSMLAGEPRIGSPNRLPENLANS